MTTQEILEAARGAKAALALADGASRAQALRSMAAQLCSPANMTAILAANADIRRPAFHINGNIRGLNPEVAYPLFGIFKNQLAAVLPDGGTIVARRLKHGVHFLPQPPLRQCNVNHALPSFRQSISSR